jgi:WXG100 family type VII secretion target
MTNIVVPTAEVDAAGQQFITKSGEVDALVKQAQSLMNNLQGQFKGQRATRINSEWQGMQQQLVNAIQTLQTTGHWLKKAATDFTNVDSSF